ncbi:hypothetical protein D3C78_1518590 [compost metagenome]
MPTLMVSSAANTCGIQPDMANRLTAVSCLRASLRFMVTPDWDVPGRPAGTVSENSRQQGLQGHQSKRHAKCPRLGKPLYEEGVFTRIRSGLARVARSDQNRAPCTKQVRILPACGAGVAAGKRRAMRV